ncbi:Mechanosensitive ion channel [Malonomonas rubra DSM 5091]|uniref:Mechanosensitive ion channel n=1 Tax=Malonomonas rubra DSM 5091 TaxID=1122189 RepID=A0A1M6L492_MALRU|nr:mechanosensitive ion channel family protein [Malonomonas rubra]SHJ66020.1 Mechanosensitive ion channel [Malonomonas rubra DSM 5091]
MRIRAKFTLLVWFLLGVCAISATQVVAQQSKEGPRFEEQAAVLDTEIRALIEDAQEFRDRAEGAEDNFARILNRRAEEAGLDAIEKVHDLTRLVIAREKEGQDPGSWRGRAAELLVGMQTGIQDYLKKVLSRKGQDATPDEPVPAALAAYEDRQTELWGRILRLLETSITTMSLARDFGLDVGAQQTFIQKSLTDAVQFLSLSLEGTLEQKDRIEKQLAVLPDDAEVMAKQRLADLKVRRLASNLSLASAMLDRMGLDDARYRQQLIEVTGKVTTDIFDWEVFKGLVSRWLENFGNWLVDNLPQLIFKVLLFLLVLWIAQAVSRLVRRLVAEGLKSSNLNISQLLKNMIVSTAGSLVLLLGLLFGLAQLGISVGPLLAGLGIAGFIVGFALQDTLGNFAAGMMILLYRPYDVGDIVEAGGIFGKVSHMSLVNTTILTFDNQTLVMPNSKIWGDVIKNVTAQEKRRVDMTFGIGYGDDIPKAEKVLTEILTSHDKVLADPAPVVRLHTLNESSVDFVVRPWVKKEDYWDVYWDVTRAVKIRFDEEDISIPFPQRDIHVYSGEQEPLTTLPPTTRPPGSIEQDAFGWRGAQASEVSDSEDEETTG